MWVKRYDYYMDDVYFQNERNRKIHVLRFTHNVCIDSTFASLQDMKWKNPEVEITYRLNDSYSEYISPTNEFNKTNQLEQLIQESGFHFKIPDEFLDKA